MDIRAEKLAKARKKLRDHQEKKVVTGPKEEILDGQNSKESLIDNANIMMTVKKTDHGQNDVVDENQMESVYVNMDIDKNCSEIKSDAITEMLLSNKGSLEIQINNMCAKLENLEYLYDMEVSNHNACKQRNIDLQNEISNLKTTQELDIKKVLTKDDEKKNLKDTIQYLHDEKNNLTEQLELTKSMLTTKESENSRLLLQLSSYQGQVDMLQIQLQQLTNDSFIKFDHDYNKSKDREALLDNIYELEHKITSMQQEKEQASIHYEHFIRDLNEKLKIENARNDVIARDLQKLYDREQELIEQISELEKRLQKYNPNSCELTQNISDSDIKNQYKTTKKELEGLIIKYNKLQKQYMDCRQENIQALTQAKEIEHYENNIYMQDNVDISKLNADIVSDKLAAQRATEQNEKLKTDMEGLAQTIVKMGKDKLELTEKWTHEKQLNKGLALKLAEVEEGFKNLQNRLKAKDDEMIRLLNEYREMERRHENALKDVSEMKRNLDADNNQENLDERNDNHDLDEEKSCHILTTRAQADKQYTLDNLCIQKEDAMIKLQERFLNIMDEVANLSDEKHRLEHIILQLQNETDTICEYVALYQQQRSLLAKREEERSKQLKIFQSECDKLKRHLEELSNLLLKFAADEELASYLKEESRHNDLTRVKELLEKLQNCSLINPKFKNLDLNIFYPCHCCSGQLIDI